jgi:transposase
MIHRILQLRSLSPPKQISWSNTLENIVKAHSELYLEELRDLLWIQDKIWTSASTIHRTLKKMNFRRQKIEEHALERFTPEALERRRNFFGEICNFSTNQIFFVDECGVDYKLLHRKFGRVKLGSKLKEIRRYVRGRKANILSCIGLHGSVAWRIIAKDTCTLDFNDFIMEEVLPQIPSGSVIVLDNASFHHSSILQATVELFDRQLLFLPPYSPDLNPIELSYSFLKTSLAQFGDCHCFVDLIAAIGSILNTITDQHTRGWYNKCMYLNVDNQ